MPGKASERVPTPVAVAVRHRVGLHVGQPVARRLGVDRVVLADRLDQAVGLLGTEKQANSAASAADIAPSRSSRPAAVGEPLKR
jgi:hypothetical protein